MTESKDDCFDQLESDPRFLERIERAGASLRNGQGVRLEDIAEAMNRRTN